MTGTIAEHQGYLLGDIAHRQVGFIRLPGP
jgi:hypothetical protein